MGVPLEFRPDSQRPELASPKPIYADIGMHNEISFKLKICTPSVW